MLSSREDRASRQRNDKRRARYEQVVRLHQQGTSQRGIARLTGLHRITVRKFIAADAFPQRAPSQPRRSILDPFIPYLHRRLSEGFDNAIALWREVVAQGYGGRVCRCAVVSIAYGRASRHSHHQSAPNCSLPRLPSKLRRRDARRGGCCNHLNRSNPNRRCSSNNSVASVRKLKRRGNWHATSNRWYANGRLMRLTRGFGRVRQATSRR